MSPATLKPQGVRSRRAAAALLDGTASRRTQRPVAGPLLCIFTCLRTPVFPTHRRPRARKRLPAGGGRVCASTFVAPSPSLCAAATVPSTTTTTTGARCAPTTPPAARRASSCLVKQASELALALALSSDDELPRRRRLPEQGRRRRLVTHRRTRTVTHTGTRGFFVNSSGPTTLIPPPLLIKVFS